MIHCIFKGFLPFGKRVWYLNITNKRYNAVISIDVRTVSRGSVFD